MSRTFTKYLRRRDYDFIVGDVDGPHIGGVMRGLDWPSRAYPKPKLRLYVEGIFATFIELSSEQVEALRVHLGDALLKMGVDTR